jgi:hypothetical protein
MAHRGPTSKTIKHGRTPNADWTDVPDTPYVGASPALPKLGSRRRWSDLVITWWDMVREMPHCVLWGPTDWHFAVETALMKQELWSEVTAGEGLRSTLATEVRRREDQMGTTGEARRKLRIRYVPADTVADAEDEPEPDIEVVEQEHAGGGRPVTSLADRRRRLSRPA